MYFKEELIGLLLSLSEDPVTIKELIQVDTYPEIIAIKVIETPEGKSYTYDYWTGYEVIVDIRLNSCMMYTLEETNDLKQIKNYTHIVSMSTVVPYKYEEKTIYELYRVNKINPMIIVEDISACMIDDRTVQCAVLLLLEFKL